MYMRKIFTLLAYVLITACVFAQSPDKMSYQAVVRDGSDALVTSATVGMQISILQSAASGTAVYIETQTPTSNANGLVSIEIGTSYTITGTSELMSVPYALYATTAENGISSVQASAITANTAKVGITTVQADEIAVNTLKTGITAAQATKLTGIEEGAEVNVQADWNQTITTADDYIKNKPTIPGEVDGSETKVTAGANITVTGVGTIDSPYVVNATRDAPLTIGQSYLGGKIFYLDASGRHGLIAATSDQSAEIRWNNGNYHNTLATKDGIGAGMYNTERIIADQGEGSYAAQICANYQGGGYGDWYLPSKYELDLLYKSKYLIGGFNNTSNSYYWSSTEYVNFDAWNQLFQIGFQDFTVKNETYRVRAIRAF